ncbi:MAG: M20 family metallopeptidase [Spirochaetes bacterium]|nr:M20 family metallopeptidase [Spirochaetota bacterium]
MDVKKQAGALQDQLVRWRRDLHRIPELGCDLPQTSKYVQGCLSQMGIPFVTMVKGSGIVATIRGEGAAGGKTVALRADMDALPIKEEAPVDFKAEGGNMHACGHDAHTAMLLGAAKILNDGKAHLNGSVKLIFQPGEENPGGAKPMIQEGALEGVDAIFGQHVGALQSDVKVSGKIVVSRGAVMACRDSFKIKIIGRGAHSSSPHLSVDPIAVAAQVINGVYMMKAREFSALDPVVISICMVRGGTANNIIPMSVEMEGSTRSLNQQTREKIAARIEAVLKNTCEAYGASYQFDFLWDYDITKNNPDMADLVIRAAKDLAFGDDIVQQASPIMGSEDMSFFLNKVPGAYYFLTSLVFQNGEVFGHHHPKFMLDESIFSKGAALLAQIAKNYLDPPANA